MTACFRIILRHSFWRVTLNGMFFGDYRSPALAEAAIAAAQHALTAPQSDITAARSS